MRIGLLSIPDDPFLGYLIGDLQQANVPITAIIFDSLTFSAKDKEIFRQRTDGRFPFIPLSIYESLRIPFYFMEDHRSPATVSLVRDLNLDLLVNAGTPRILKKEILSAPRVGVVNCHPGLLPRFRGCTCVEWAIYLDEQVGNTVHFVDEGIDSGPIILQEGLNFSKSDSYVDVRVKVYRHSIQLLAKGLRKIIDEKLNPAALPAQVDGQYFKVIEEDKHKDVVSKLQRGAYAYQK